MADDQIKLQDANKEFCAELYQKGLLPLKGLKVDKKNLIFSPYSLHSVLGMVLLGAEDDTETRFELIDGLKFEDGAEDESIAERYKSVIKSLKKKGSFTLLDANKVYCSAGYKLDENYKKTIQDTFQADFEQVDVSTKKAQKAAADNINQWVSKSTEGKIQKIVEAASLDEDMRVLLVNAIYFKGKWEMPFSVGKNKEREFKLNKTDKVKVKMMEKLGRFHWADLKDLDATACALPYKGGRLAMIIILPNKADGLEKVQASIEKFLGKGKFTIKKNFTKEKVDLEVPKFKFEITLEGLKEALQLLGMEEMFSKTDAKFGKMIANDEEEKTDGLYVSDVIQRAYIEVDEEGTTAAAVTATTMAKGCSGRPKRETIRYFICDHPFYFQIVDQNNEDLVLFAGHCLNPSS